jgi:hypothetical protein
VTAPHTSPSGRRPCRARHGRARLAAEEGALIEPPKPALLDQKAAEYCDAGADGEEILRDALDALDRAQTSVEEELATDLAYVGARSW